MVWQLILSIALLVCSVVIFSLVREINRLQKLKDAQTSTASSGVNE